MNVDDLLFLIGKITVEKEILARQKELLEEQLKALAEKLAEQKPPETEPEN